jgi:hypothetical protein
MMQEQVQAQKFSGRGKPKNGFRMTLGRKLAIEQAKANGVELDLSHFTQSKPDFVSHLLKQKQEMDISHPPKKELSEKEIYDKLALRFSLLEEITLATAMGINPSLIVSGPAGLGKSFGVEKVLNDLAIPNLTYIKGYVKPTGAYKALYNARHAGSVVVFDDADSIFDTEQGMNILKAACDSSEIRNIAWLAEHRMEDEDGDRIPNQFDFEGSVIFITNKDFIAESNSNSRMSVHYQAMVSRSMYLDLELKSKQDYLVRIKQVLLDFNMFGDKFTTEQKNDMFNFMVDNQNIIRELSLRMCKKLGIIMDSYPNDWKEKAKILACRGV